MQIFWKYIDKRQAAVNALKDRPYMEFILANTEKEIQEAYDSLTDLRSVNLEKVSSSHGPHSSEDRIIGVLERIDLKKERYAEAKEYMAWFLPAWNALNEEDQWILDTYYGQDHEYGDNVADEISEHFNIERSSAYRRKNRALERLTMLLYG